MKFTVVVVLALICVAAGSVEKRDLYSSDVHRSTEELITEHGYPVKIYTRYTKDDYALVLHRIPYGKDGPSTEARPAVLLLHGLLDSSASWVLLGPQKSLAFLLADKGYDVWMGNMRGNVYSNKHKTKDPRSPQYWAFSLDDLALYDLPTMVDAVLDESKQTQLHMVAHGQGSLLMFMALSEYGDALASKVKSMSLLAPLAFLNHQNSLLIESLSLLRLDLVDRFKWVQAGQFLPAESWLKSVSLVICQHLPWPCNNLLYLFWGTNHTPMHNINPDRVPEILAHFPAGTSTSVMAHYVQLARSANRLQTGKLLKYDFGASANMRKYGQRSPPEYDLGKAKVPMLLVSGGADDLANPFDVELIFSRVPKEYITSQFRHVNEYSHVDFVYAEDAHDKVYPRVEEHIKNSN